MKEMTKNYSIKRVLVVLVILCISIMGLSGCKDKKIEETESVVIEETEDKFSAGNVKIEVEPIDETKPVVIKETESEEGAGPIKDANNAINNVYGNQDISTSLNGIDIKESLSEEDATQLDLIISSKGLSDKQVQEMINDEKSFNNVKDRDSLYKEALEARKSLQETTGEEQDAGLIDMSGDKEMEKLIKEAQENMEAEQASMEPVGASK